MTVYESYLLVQETRQKLRDWSKSTGEGWARAFKNVVVRKHMTHLFHLAQK